MHLYNTLSKKTEEVSPIDKRSVRMYTCGPTIYDRVHIGNLGSFIFADMLRRTLLFTGLGVHHVMNFTDVDDKTIRRSAEMYPDQDPKIALQTLTDQYGRLFLADMELVGNDTRAVNFIKATDSIEAMQTLINELVMHGFAYLTDDGIYFSIEAYKKNGKVYGQLTDISDSSTSEARIQNDEYDKESIHDFALWKLQKEGEPAWDYEVDGRNLMGRPGWHIECSAMSHRELGQPFDIHTGGVDLIFPHHENEIAQSTAGKDDPVFARVFAHNEHMLVDNQKMSKSLRNFYTLDDVQKKGFHPLALRMLVLQSHYRSQAHFSWVNLEAAQRRLDDLYALAALRWQARDVTYDSSTFALEDIPEELSAALQDDLNTPLALTRLSAVTTELLTVLINKNQLKHFEYMLAGIDKLLGVNLLAVKDISKEQKELVGKREAARAHEDWITSDSLRNELGKQGIGLRDTPYGVIWFPLSAV